MFKKLKYIKSYEYAAQSRKNFFTNRIVEFISDLLLAAFITSFVVICMSIFK